MGGRRGRIEDIRVLPWVLHDVLVLSAELFDVLNLNVQLLVVNRQTVRHHFTHYTRLHTQEGRGGEGMG